jgi:hypothetical protein
VLASHQLQFEANKVWSLEQGDRTLLVFDSLEDQSTFVFGLKDGQLTQVNDSGINECAATLDVR